MNDFETRIRDALQQDVSRVPLIVGMPKRVRSRVRHRRAATTIVAATAAIAVVAGSVFALRDVDRDRTAPEHRPAAPSIWSPLREGGASIGHRGDDPLDASVPWVDVTWVGFSTPFDQPTWQLELAAKPPRAADLEPGVVIAHGLVLETTGDDVPDYLVGIENGLAPREGDFHVWVTDLVTGETDEQFGPPYGLPIDFIHSDQHQSIWLFFLPGGGPSDLDPETVRFYAWASESVDGEVLAWDYAPDTGWVTRT